MQRLIWSSPPFLQWTGGCDDVLTGMTMIDGLLILTQAMQTSALLCEMPFFCIRGDPLKRLNKHCKAVIRCYMAMAQQCKKPCRITCQAAS